MIKLKYILLEMDLPPGVPKPFEGVDIITNELPDDIRGNFHSYPDLPSPILYIHSFFPKEEFRGKGFTKAWVLKYLSDWKTGRLTYDNELNAKWGSRGLRDVGRGSEWFGTYKITNKVNMV